MGLLDRLLTRPTGAQSPRVDAVVIEANGERVEVVGESHYLGDLMAITGRRAREQVRHPVVAVLLREPNNPYDPNAVAVHVDGRKVGYLSREDAAAYQRVLQLLAQSHKALACNALVCGREGTQNLGVFLELPSPDETFAQLA